MLTKLRALIQQSPRLGWLTAVLLLIVVVFLVLRMRSGPGAYSYERMAQDVRIRCAETGEEWTMPRGRMEADLLARAGPIDPNEGIVNPKTGRPTGFPVTEWRQTIDRLNAAKQELAAGGGARASGGSRSK